MRYVKYKTCNLEQGQQEADDRTLMSIVNGCAQPSSDTSGCPRLMDAVGIWVVLTFMRDSWGTDTRWPPLFIWVGTSVSAWLYEQWPIGGLKMRMFFTLFMYQGAIAMLEYA